LSKDVKNSGVERTDRVELSGAFEVHSHDNGFQLRRSDRSYSIIAVAFEQGINGVREIGWEVLVYGSEGGKEQFDLLRL